MLDMSVRAKILELMIALKRDLELTYLYITHDLATAKFFCDRIAIMYLGKDRRDRPGGSDLRRPEAPVHAGTAPRDPRAGSGAARCRETCREARCRTPRCRRSDAPSIPAVARAFEPCGWESRDLRDLLETRWALAAGAAGAAVVEEEQALVGDLGVLARPSTNVRLSAGRKAADDRRAARPHPGGEPGGAVLARRRAHRDGRAQREHRLPRAASAAARAGRRGGRLLPPLRLAAGSGVARLGGAQDRLAPQRRDA